MPDNVFYRNLFQIKFNIMLLILVAVLVAILLSPISYQLSQPHEKLLRIDDIRFSPDGKNILLDALSMKNLARNYVRVSLDQSDTPRFVVTHPPSQKLYRASVAHFDNQQKIILEAHFDDYFVARTMYALELAGSSGREQQPPRNATQEERRQAIANASNRHRWSLRDLKSGIPNQIRLNMNPISQIRPGDEFWFSWRTPDDKIFQLWKRIAPDGSVLVAKIDQNGGVIREIDLGVTTTVNVFGNVRFLAKQEIVFPSANCQHFVISHKRGKSDSIVDIRLYDKQLNLLAKDFGTIFQFSQNGQYLAAYSHSDDLFRIIRVSDGETIFERAIRISKLEQIDKVAVSNDGQRLAIGYESKRGFWRQVIVLDTAAQKRIYKSEPWPFPYFVTFLLLIAWGLLWGRFCLKPVKPLPMGARSMRWIFAYAIIFGAGATFIWFGYLGVIDGWMHVIWGLFYAIFLVPVITRPYIETDGTETPDVE